MSLCKESNTVTAATKGSVIYPVVVVKVKNIICKALIDTGAGSSYAYSAFLEELNIQLVRKETKRIGTIMHSVDRNIDAF